MPAGCGLSIWATESGSPANLEWIKVGKLLGTNGKVTLAGKRKIPTKSERHLVHYKPRNGAAEALPFKIKWMPSVPAKFEFTGDLVKKVSQSCNAAIIRQDAQFRFQDEYGNNCARVKGKKFGELHYWGCDDGILRVSLSITSHDGKDVQSVTLHGLTGGEWKKNQYVFELKRQLDPQNIAIAFPGYPKDCLVERQELLLSCRAESEFSLCFALSLALTFPRQAVALAFGPCALLCRVPNWTNSGDCPGVCGEDCGTSEYSTSTSTSSRFHHKEKDCRENESPASGYAGIANDTRVDVAHAAHAMSSELQGILCQLC